MLSNEVKTEIVKLEERLSKRVRKTTYMRVGAIICIVLAIVGLGISFLAHDNFYTPFWLGVAGGLLGVHFIFSSLALLLGNLCDMLKMQIITFKVTHNIKDMPKITETTTEEKINRDRGFEYVGGLKLETYNDDETE